MSNTNDSNPDLALVEAQEELMYEGPEMHDDEILCEDDYDDSMDGDHDSALASVGWGTDENYGYYGGDEDF